MRKILVLTFLSLLLESKDFTPLFSHKKSLSWEQPDNFFEKMELADLSNTSSLPTQATLWFYDSILFNCLFKCDLGLYQTAVTSPRFT